MVFSFLGTTPNIGYSGDFEWMLDQELPIMLSQYDWFSTFEKLDGCFLSSVMIVHVT